MLHWKKQCKNILAIKNIQQDVSDYILPNYFMILDHVQAVTILSLDKRQWRHSSLNFHNRADHHAVSKRRTLITQ